MGTAMPYAIFAPLFINDGGIFSQTVNSSVTLNFTLGVTLAAYPLGQFIGAPIIGRLSDIKGRKKILVSTLFYAATGYFLSAIAIYNGNIYILIVSRFITGLFEANFAVAQAFVIDLTDNKQKDLGRLSAIISLAYIMGPVIGAILCNAHIVSWFSYSTPFIFAGIGAIILGFLVNRHLKDVRIINPNKDTKASLLAQFNIFKNLSQCVETDSVKWLLISSSFLSLSIMTYYEFYPIILASNWAMTSMHIAFVSVIYSISLSIGALYIPCFIKRNFSIYIPIILILSIMTISYLFLISGSIFLVYLQFIILGLAYGTVNNLQMVMLSDEARDDQQGEVLGFRISFAMLGSAIICIIGGLIMSISVNITIIICCVFAMISIIAILMLKNSQKTLDTN